MNERKFLILFVSLLVSLILYPYAGDSGFRYYGFRALTIVVTLLSVYAVSFRRTLALFTLLLAVPASLRHTAVGIAHAGTVTVLAYVFGFVFDAAVIYAIFIRVYGRQEADEETVLGALCVYLLLGFGFANLFLLVAALQPQSFYLDPAANLHVIPSRMDILYYSFATMTAVGANGITPVTAQARSLSIIESILGVLYLAVLVARLVSAYRPTGPKEATNKES